MNLGFDLNEWDSIEAIESGEFESLSLGGHVVEIVDARVYKNENNGNVSLKVCVDIAKDDKQAGYFKKQYEENSNANKKWSNGATRYLSLKKENLKYLKGFVETTLPNSNPNFKFDKTKGWEQINNLKCVGVFGLEEYEKQDGTIGTATKLVQFRSLDKLNQVKIPKVKLIDGSTIDYEEYRNRKNDSANLSQLDTDDAVAINPEDLPF